MMNISKVQKFQVFFTFVFLFVAIVSPFSLEAQTEIIPSSCGNVVNGKLVECGYYDLLRLVNNVIKWIIMISAPVAAGVFAWAGILYMTTGVSDKKAQAKEMLIKVFLGFVFILSAWIIVSTIVKVFFKDPSIVPVEIK